MERMRRPRFSQEQKTELWARWKSGHSITMPARRRQPWHIPLMLREAACGSN